MAATHYHFDQFPPKRLDWEKLIPLIGPASAALARDDGVLHGVPDADVLLAPLTTQEAVLSSKIEGTQATFGEVLEFEAAEETAGQEKRGEIQEVLNYRSALRHSVQLLNTVPLSQRVVKETHNVLMQGVRGQSKSPGEFRRTPNWIGPAGCTIEGASFVPPGAERVIDAMSSWERYLHAESNDRLVQLAILHVEFEAIHPFLDGNGRVGRLLIPLFLMHKKLLSGPNFYISAYLDANRDEYIGRLLAVSRDGDWTGWCAFFLRAMIEQAQANELKARAVLDLYAKRKDWITELTHSQYAVRALDWFFGRPIFRTSAFAVSSGIPKPTANRILRLAREKGMFWEVRAASGRRPAILAFRDLLNIVEGDDLF